MSRKVKAWETRINNGLCKYCGLNPFMDGSHICEICNKDRYSKYKNRPYNSPEKRQAYHVLLKRTVLEKYGANCQICGEYRWECLTIDHINQDGAKDRKSNKNPYQFYLRLKREPIRQDLRVLCMNCNWSIAQWGYSPFANDAPPFVSFEQATQEYKSKWSSRKRYTKPI